MLKKKQAGRYELKEKNRRSLPRKPKRTYYQRLIWLVKNLREKEK